MKQACESVQSVASRIDNRRPRSKLRGDGGRQAMNPVLLFGRATLFGHQKSLSYNDGLLVIDQS